MSAVESTCRSSKKPLAVAMIGAAVADTTGMDDELAALMGVLDEAPGAPSLDLVAEANEPAVELIRSKSSSSGGEMLSIEDVMETDETVEMPVVLVADAPAMDAELAALLDVLGETPKVVHTDEAVNAAVAGLELSERYAAVPADEAPHDGATTEEIGAAGVEVAPAAVKAPKEPKVAKNPRVHYENKTDRIKQRLVEKLGDYLVFELSDAELEGDALKAKQAETLAVIDAMSVEVRTAPHC